MVRDGELEASRSSWKTRLGSSGSMIASFHDDDLSRQSYRSDGLPVSPAFTRSLGPILAAVMACVIVSLTPARSERFNARSQPSSIYRQLMGFKHAGHITIKLRPTNVPFCCIARQTTVAAVHG